MMVNASADERMPRAQVDELFRSAGQPKEMIWMSGGHVHGDVATITRLVDIVMARVREVGPPLAVGSRDSQRASPAAAH
jgi:hypothetical protein